MHDIGGLPVACNRDCGATCALVTRRSEASLVLRSNPLNNPYKRPCARGLKSPLGRNAPDRLLKPLRRIGGRGSDRFQEITWEAALAEIAERLGAVIETSGAQAILNMGGSGACKGALHNTSGLTSRFLNQLGPVTRLEGSYSFQAASFVLPYMFGGALASYDVQTLLDTRFVILWGANISDTRFGNET